MYINGLIFLGVCFVNVCSRGIHSNSRLFYNYSPKKYLSYNQAKDLILEFDKNDLYTGFESDVKSLEHIWPQSYFIDNHVLKKKDMHLLTQIDLKTNIFRSNYKFIDSKLLKTDYFSKQTINFKNISKNTKDKVFFTPDRTKGIISRSIAYSVLVYPDLFYNLNKVIDKNDLIDWSISNPVTDYELERNDYIKFYQGNDNPFIIHPDLIYIFK